MHAEMDAINSIIGDVLPAHPLSYSASYLQRAVCRTFQISVPSTEICRICEEV